MNVCDENIDADQRRQLRALKIHYRHIGTEIGRKGLKDRNEIIPLLHSLRRPTLFSRDHKIFINLICDTAVTAWSTLMSSLTKLRGISAAFRAIRCSARRPNEWAK